MVHRQERVEAYEDVREILCQDELISAQSNTACRTGPDRRDDIGECCGKSGARSDRVLVVPGRFETDPIGACEHDGPATFGSRA